jgi:RNA polymerase sigma-70 factor (ECF subfamily)
MRLVVVSNANLTSPLAALDERALLPRYAAGDLVMFDEMMRRYRSAIYGYIVRCGIPPAAADDVFQDVFFNVHRSAASYCADHALRPWLFTIAANAVRSHFRKKSVIARMFSSAEARDVEALEPTLQLRSEGDELAAYLDARIKELPLKQREVVVLCCIEQLSLDETALALAMPLETVKTNLKRARAALAKALERRAKSAVREVRDG